LFPLLTPLRRHLTDTRLRRHPYPTRQWHFPSAQSPRTYPDSPPQPQLSHPSPSPRRRRPTSTRPSPQPVAAGVGAAPHLPFPFRKGKRPLAREVFDGEPHRSRQAQPMSSAAARSESGAGPATAHELAMQQPPQQQEVVAAAAEVQAPPPGSVVVAAAEVPAPVVVATAEVPAQAPGAVLTIVISKPEEEEAREQKGVAPASLPPLEVGDASAMVAVAAAKEAELARSDSFDEQCRVCQQKSEEPLVDLGCRCRGDLSKAHRTCIDVWFRTRGSNKCEICQQVAVNIPPPETQACTSYWVWRVDSAYGRGRGGRERGWFSPLWVAFAILIGGLLLDVLISVSLGVSALPVNIIIGME
uniref:RING-CH-type domain-containing protein n=1 Tax=Aegilops tauschii subsp. strangulata TaxID=200361 RepID=A0A452YGD3_AEGTS